MNATLSLLSLPGARVRSHAAVALLIAIPLTHATSRWATLEAIHQLENPTDSPRPGPCGDLGAYQFREQTWKRYTQAPFSHATDRKLSDEVAARHYDWLTQVLRGAGLEPSAYNVALAWNGGVRGTIRDTAPARAHDYAERASNLAEYFERTQGHR